MANTTFKYASQRDLQDILPDIDSYDSKEIIRNFELIETGESLYVSNDCGVITNLYENGKELDGKLQVDDISASSVTGETTTETISISETSITMSDTHVDFAVGRIIKIGTEYMLIYKVSGSRVDVVRGVLNTEPQYHATSQAVSIPATSDVIDINGENYTWFYDEHKNRLIMWAYKNPNDDLIIESGEDYKTYVDRMLVNGAQELSSLLDGRFPRPIPPVFLDGASTSEYDYPLIRANALLTASYMVQTKDIEYAEQLYSQVTNAEGTGLADRINSGAIKLAFEIDKTDSSGDIVEITNTGTMKLVETHGSWLGEKYDRIKIKCTTLGAYGTAICSVQTYGSDQLYGTTNSSITISGTLQNVIGGIYARFEGSAMAVDDEWDIIVRNEGMVETNTNAYSVGLYR
tara:strand:+ start:750 stop:1964 length:1215 start_codon:yes stop_codon:yes gene_type:complete